MESVNGKHSEIYKVSLSGLVRKGKEKRNKEGKEEVREQATSVGKHRLYIVRRERGRKEPFERMFGSFLYLSMHIPSD